MKPNWPCSRCGHTEPNAECYACASEAAEEPDCFSLTKDAAFRDDASFFQFIIDGSNCPDAFIEQQ